jgi:hypothetical protein
MTPSALDTDQTLEDFDPGVSPMERQQIHGGSGQRYPKSSDMMRNINAPQPYANLKTNQLLSPERMTGSNKGNVNDPRYSR